MSNATKMARTTSGMVRKTGLRGKGKPVGGRALRLMVETVRVTFWPEPRVTDAGLKEQVIVEVAGDIVGQVRLTVPVNEPVGATAIVLLAGLPAVTVTLLGGWGVRA